MRVLLRNTSKCQSKSPAITSKARTRNHAPVRCDLVGTSACAVIKPPCTASGYRPPDAATILPLVNAQKARGLVIEIAYRFRIDPAVSEGNVTGRSSRG